MSSEIALRLAEVRERVAQAAHRAGRSVDGITLIAVSKGVASDALRCAGAAGQRDFGENYAQEFTEKALALTDLDPVWHFVGRLQRNKVRALAGRVALLHTVDSVPLIGEIDKRANGIQEVLLQLSLSGEPQKGGASPELLPTLLRAAAHSKYVRCVGLMTMPPASPDPKASRPFYRALRQLAELHALAQLSMGMSQDFEVAIDEGATLVRIGRAIFGERRDGSN